MKHIKYIFLIAIVSVFFTSCDERTNTLVEEIEAQPNTIGFVDRALSFSGISDGTQYPSMVPFQVVGPSSRELTGTYTATITVDASSTAEEGVHFSIPNKTLEVSAENDNLLGLVEIIMLSEGIEAPLATAPVAVLNVTAATGSGNIIASGAQLRISLLYLCPSELAGSYEATIVRDDGLTAIYPDVLTETGVGQYRSTTIGTWGPGAIGGTPGFDFTDVCDVITIPQQDLVDFYSNQVFQAGESARNPDTGVITCIYTITFGSGDRTYTHTFVPQ